MLDSAFQYCDHMWLGARLATMEPADSGNYGERSEQAIGVRDGKFAIIVPMATIDLDRLKAGTIQDVGGAWITPGLVDCHTHLLYGGDRSGEIEMRRHGVSYAEIARRGGGILATVQATRALGESQLIEVSLPRLETLAAEGVTTVEIKSGYGLSLDEELKMLLAAKRLGRARAGERDDHATGRRMPCRQSIGDGRTST